MDVKKFISQAEQVQTFDNTIYCHLVNPNPQTENYLYDQVAKIHVHPCSSKIKE